MSPAANPIGAAPSRAASHPPGPVGASWIPGELLLRRAVRSVNEELAIVGLRLRLEPAEEQAPGTARHYVRCVGESAPLGGAHALVTVHARTLSAQLIGVPAQRSQEPPKTAPASLAALCDFLLAIAEALACPAGGASAPNV